MGENRMVVEFFFEKPQFSEVKRIGGALEEAGIKTLVMPPEDRNINTHLIVEIPDREKATEKLNEMGISFKAKERLLIRLMNKPGTMAEMVKKISEKGINLIYAFCVTMNSEHSYLLLGAADNAAALEIVKNM